MSYVTSPVLSQNDDIVSFYPWYANSATTSHLTNVRSAFIDYKPIEPIPIYGLGKAYVLAYGQGTVEAYSFQEGKYHTFETFYTPDHPDNLLSIGRIDNNGGKIIFGKNKVVLYDSKNNIVVNGKLTSNRLYQLNIYKRIYKNTAEISNITTIKNNTWDQWHQRFGHVSILGLQRLHNDNLVEGLDID